MKNDVDNLSRSVSQHDNNEQSTFSRDESQRHQAQHQYSSSCSSLTSGIGQSDQSISNDRVALTNISDLDIDKSAEPYVPTIVTSVPETNAELPPLASPISDPKLELDIRNFVDNIFTDSQSISLEKKAEFGKLVRSSEARLLFAKYVDDYRVNSKRVSELAFYSLAQYFSIVLFECLLAEDFRPAKIIMNMMFTYYHDQCYDKIPLNDRPTTSDGGDTITEQETDGQPKIVRTYLYTLLKDQQIFKSIRFWTSAFYESVIIERNNHPVFVDREHGKLSKERRNEESDCSKNITFGLLGSFIHNMSLLDLDREFCQEFLDKHSTIAGLSEDQLEMLRANLKTMFSETSNDKSSGNASRSDKLATFLHKLSNRLNHPSSSSQAH